jgi:triacylglycerol lipase
MRRTTVVSIAVLAFFAVGMVPASGASRSWPGRARYSVSTRTLDAARDCSAPLTGKTESEPVLLVHGTGFEREHDFEWNYWGALPDAGFEVCWIRLPRAALGDIQIAAEYAARAVEVMHARTGRRIDILGHSQGGVVPRWAIKYFPSGRFVDDYVALAAPNHGTLAADLLAASGETFEAIWQMRLTARFMQALNRGDETPGPISYTSIYTANDDQVQPASTAALKGGSNIVIQDVCAGRIVTHNSIVADAVAYALVLDAFTNRGAADPDRVGVAPCFTLTMPLTPVFPALVPDWRDDVISSREPPLKRYARR